MTLSRAVARLLAAQLLLSVAIDLPRPWCWVAAPWALVCAWCLWRCDVLARPP